MRENLPFKDVVLTRSGVDERRRILVHELRLLGELSMRKETEQ